MKKPTWIVIYSALAASLFQSNASAEDNYEFLCSYDGASNRYAASSLESAKLIAAWYTAEFKNFEASRQTVLKYIKCKQRVYRYNCTYPRGPLTRPMHQYEGSYYVRSTISTYEPTKDRYTNKHGPGKTNCHSIDDSSPRYTVPNQTISDLNPET